MPRPLLTSDGRRRTRSPRAGILRVLGVLGVLTACPGAAAVAPIADDPPPRAEMTSQERSDLDFYAAILRNPASEPSMREGAVARLIDMDARESVAVLDVCLREGDTSLRLAVIRGLSTRRAPVPGLLDAAVDALRTASPETLPELAVILARYENAALVRVGAVAQDTRLPVTERLGAIHALGSFPTRASGDWLIGLADPRQGSDGAIRDAALASLRRLAPADFGDDFAAWRVWWGEVRDMSQEEWARELVKQFQVRNSELERTNDALAGRLVEVLRELYRTVDLAGQLERLPRDLDDELVPVRAFAMERITRLLRDSVIIPPALREKVVRCLDDEAPTGRRQAAVLLAELDEPNLGSLIAERLPAEKDRQVIATYLDVLANRPTPTALASLLVWIPDEQFGQAAADALWPVLRELGPSGRAPAREPLRTALEQRPGRPGARPALVRLLALVGNESDLALLLPMLDGTEATLKAAVSEGIYARGRRQPLIDRAADPVIYPWTLRSLAEGRAGLAAFQVLVDLAPPDGAHDQWAAAVRRLASRLDPQSLLDADRMLHRLTHSDLELRSAILARAAVLAPDAYPATYRIELMRRLAPMLIEQGDSQRAFDLLDALDGAGEVPGLVELKFEAALLAGRFDAAARLDGGPSAWVKVFERVADRGSVAGRLHDEIVRRFGDELPDDLRSDFEAASARLSPSATEGAGSRTRAEGSR